MRKFIKLENLSHEEWLKARKKGIGGSDIAAVCGLSSYKSPLWIYLDKTGQLPEQEQENIAAELGLVLEPFLSKKFVKWINKNEGIEIKLMKMPYILQDDEVDYFLVNLDRFFKHPDRGYCAVELKTTTEFKRDLWSKDVVPDEYYMQVQWQLMITGWQWCYLVYLIGNRTFDVKLIKKNEEVIKNLRDKGKEFWTEYVEKNEPPAPIGLKSDSDALNILYPEEYPDLGDELTGEEEEAVVKAIEVIEEQKEVEKRAKNNITKAQQVIKSIIKSREYVIAGGRLITYKTVNIPERFMKATSYRKLYISKQKGGKK